MLTGTNTSESRVLIDSVERKLCGSVGRYNFADVLQSALIPVPSFLGKDVNQIDCEIHLVFGLQLPHDADEK
jgi:hypothetical protein